MPPHAPRSSTKAVRLCALCHGHLVVVGYARRGGARHNDWPGRRYHKRCYRMARRGLA